MACLNWARPHATESVTRRTQHREEQLHKEVFRATHFVHPRHTQHAARGDQEKLVGYVERNAPTNTEIVFASHGKIALSLLDGATNVLVDGRGYGDSTVDESNLEWQAMPDCGYVCDVNRGEGFESIGWRFDPGWVFSRQKILSFLHQLVADRAKAVFITDEGIFAYNRDRENLLEVELDECLESRVEIITAERESDWQIKLLECQVSD